MPKDGFKSITLPEAVYQRFNNDYDNNRKDLAIRGVRSLSGYISHLLEERMAETEVLARQTPVIKKVSFDGNRVVLLDSVANRIAEVIIQGGDLVCQLCERDNCMHVGFAYSLPEVNKALDTRGAGEAA